MTIRCRSPINRVAVVLALASLMLHAAALLIHTASATARPAAAAARLAADLAILCHGGRTASGVPGVPPANTPANPPANPPGPRIECPICQGHLSACAALPVLASDWLIVRTSITVAFACTATSGIGARPPRPMSRGPPALVAI